MPSELVYFHKGLNYAVRSAMQEPGSLRTCENLCFEKEGDQTYRTRFTAMNTTATGAIHSLRRFRDLVLSGDGTHLRRKWADSDGDLTDLYGSFTNAIWRSCEYKDFLHCVNGNEQVLFDEDGNLFPGSVANPVSAPSLAASGTGSMTGNYMGYVSYYLTWPNGMTYETGLSTASSNCAASSDAQIDWTSIPVSPYAAYNASSFTTYSLILHGTGEDGSTTITDSCGHTVTAYGSTQIDTAYKKYGTGSIYVPNSTSWYDVADSDSWFMDTGAFAIHFWVRFGSLPTAGNETVLFGQYDSGFTHTVVGQLYNDSGDYVLYMTVTNGETVHGFYVPFTGLVVNTWYHLAFIRGWGGATDTEAGWAICINGTAGTNVVTDSNPTVAWPQIAGVLEFGGLSYVNNFWLDEVCIAKGDAVWTSNFTPPTDEITGSALTIHRKLYRGPGTGGTLADIYYVATISDNTTTTYTDTKTDAQLAANGSCAVDDYGPGPTKSQYIAYHYGQAFWLDADIPHRLWFSEPAAGDTAEENEDIMPIACLSDNWDDIRVAGFETVDPQGIISWGQYLYIPLKHTWIKKQGNNAETWTYKKVWANLGVSAPHTIDISSNPSGIISVSQSAGGEAGLAIFNGGTSQIVTSPRFDYIFNTHLSHTYIHKCRGAFAGKYYVLIYPSTSSSDGEPDTIAAFDFRRFPDIRLSMWCDLAGRSIASYNQGKVFYIGGSDGKLRRSDSASTEAVDVVVESHDLIGGRAELAAREKHLKTLRYAIDSGGGNVTMTVYIDGTAATWPDGTTSKTITGSSEAVQYIGGFPKNFRGYRFRIHLSASAVTTFHLYSPWEVEFDATM